MPNVVSVALAALAGAMLPVQAAVNARLARVVGSALWAAAFSGLILTVVLAVVAAVVTRGAPRLTGTAALPWWSWTGGLYGAVVLSAMTAIAPRLGTASMVALAMAGQVACSLMLDKCGLLGLAAHDVGLKRSFAALLLLLGAALMR